MKQVEFYIFMQERFVRSWESGLRGINSLGSQIEQGLPRHGPPGGKWASGLRSRPLFISCASLGLFGQRPQEHFFRILPEAGYVHLSGAEPQKNTCSQKSAIRLAAG